MKKLMAAVLAMVILASLTACDKSSKYTIGICQLVQHAALDSATQGFQDALNKLLPGQVEFLVENASGESVNCTTIVNTFVSKDVDLIMANATSALQSAHSATSEIPILGTSVTAYGVALDIENFDGTVGGNVSGTSDLASLDDTANMIEEWFPDAARVGLLYCSSEANSIYQVDEVARRLEAKSYEVKRFAFTDQSDVASVTRSACEYSDIIYIPTDNTAASNTETIADVVIPAGIPVIAGDEGICSGCGICTLAISYYDLGYTTGEMAAKILTGEAKIAELPIGYAQATRKYNPVNCEKLGLTVPDGYEAIQ